jgi:ABC-type amino acid transport substrate-binding protein
MKIRQILICVLLLISLISCNQKGKSNEVFSYDDLEGKRVGLIVSAVFDKVVLEDIRGQLVYYEEVPVAVEGVIKGEIDGFITDLSSARLFVAMDDDRLQCIEVPSEIFRAPMGAVSLNQDLVDKFNEFLGVIKADGTLIDMQNRWLRKVPDANQLTPDIHLKNTNGIITVATTNGDRPFAHRADNGELTGYSVEMIKRFADYAEVALELIGMDFSEMIPTVLTGGADMAIADISITEARKQLGVIFTNPTYDDQAGIIILK